MNGHSVNQKLELVQQIRSRYQNDQNDLYRREEILYGTDRGYEHRFSSLPLRAVLTAAALVLLILGDRTGSSLFGLTAGKCFSAISTDYESSIAAWADAASYYFSGDASETNYDDRPLKDNPPAGVRPQAR